MARGVKTSEFWVMVIAAVLTEVNALTNGGISVQEAAAVWGPAVAYIASRGLAKLGGKA